MLGLRIEQTEGAPFWLRVMTEIKSRGVEDILIALIDGLADGSRRPRRPRGVCTGARGEQYADRHEKVIKTRAIFRPTRRPRSCST